MKFIFICSSSSFMVILSCHTTQVLRMQAIDYEGIFLLFMLVSPSLLLVCSCIFYSSHLANLFVDYHCCLTCAATSF